MTFNKTNNNLVYSVNVSSATFLSNSKFANFGENVNSAFLTHTEKYHVETSTKITD